MPPTVYVNRKTLLMRTWAVRRHCEIGSYWSQPVRIRGYSSRVELLPSKQKTGFRVSISAPVSKQCQGSGSVLAVFNDSHGIEVSSTSTAPSFSLSSKRFSPALAGFFFVQIVLDADRKLPDNNCIAGRTAMSY